MSKSYDAALMVKVALDAAKVPFCYQRQRVLSMIVVQGGNTIWSEGSKLWAGEL